ncbi:MAG: flagellar basal-body rod protein FlgG [Sphingomonadales bacterium]|nr:flagellar basal-body rod protein FlgG [Sphingomonadales bacterium]
MSSAALQVARTGLSAQDTRMQVIANNLANVNTTAFKSERANFATLTYQDMRVAGEQSTSASDYATGLNLGTGVAVQSTSRTNTQGTLNSTGNSFDLAIEGDGYFQVLLPSGTIAYTRAGNFSLSATGQVVTSDGYAVQPAITIPAGSSAVTIGPDGTVSAIAPGTTVPSQLGQITTATFTNPAALQATSNNYLLETAASGAPQVAPAGTLGSGTIAQGMLETSNVDIVTQLVDMIECQRGYEINSKMISSVDDMLKNADQTL